MIKRTNIKIGFSYCQSLKEVVLHDNISDIETYAFEKTAIEDLYIPESVKRIGRLGKINRITQSEIWRIPDLVLRWCMLRLL